MKTIISYKQALKKQWPIFIVGFLLIIALGWRLSPLNTPGEIIYFSIICIGAGILMINFIRRYANQVLCRNCHTNIYQIIEQCNHEKIAIKYCPVCASEIRT